MPPFTSYLRLVNRNLQITLLAGTALFTLLSESPIFAAVLHTASTGELYKLMVLSGLPAMLLIMCRASRQEVERVMARGVATLTCGGILLHSVITWSSAVFLILVISFMVMTYVTWLQRVDDRSQACT